MSIISSWICCFWVRLCPYSLPLEQWLHNWSGGCLVLEQLCDTQRPRAREKPQQDGRGAKSHLESNPIPTRDGFSSSHVWMWELDSSMDMNLSKSWEVVMDSEAWCPAVHWVSKSWTQLSNWTELMPLLTFCLLDLFLIEGYWSFQFWECVYLYLLAVLSVCFT